MNLAKHSQHWLDVAVSAIHLGLFQKNIETATLERSGVGLRDLPDQGERLVPQLGGAMLIVERAEVVPQQEQVINRRIIRSLQDSLRLREQAFDGARRAQRY